jgi:biopolymer transport protein ExbB
MGAIELVKQGGWLMAPIAALSVAAVTIFLERLWRLQRRSTVPPGFVRTLLALLDDGAHSQALQVSNQNDSLLARVMRQVLPLRGLSRAAMKERMGEVGEGEIVYLEKRLGILGTIATISPLMGLLGTITGMIQVFRQISTEANPAVSALAGGIWEALLTTAAGLVVAIPAYVGHRYLQGIVEERSQELADACYSVLAKTHPEEEEGA